MSARCAVHAETIARASNCRRCGNFACDECFGHPQSELCASCAELEGQHPSDFALPERQRKQRQWMRRNPRLAGLAFAAFGFVLVAVNLASIIMADRYYVALFPLGGALMGLGASGVLTGRMGVARLKDAPWHYWVISGGLTAVGGLGGLALNFL